MEMGAYAAAEIAIEAIIAERVKGLAELEQEYIAALRLCREAEKSESMARSNTCTAHNRLNEITKQIDTKLAEMRKEAPRESDWHRVGRG